MIQSPRLVTHVISGLSVGGAESMLSRLLPALMQFGATQEVVSLTSIGPVGASLQSRGIGVTSLGMRHGVPDPRGLLRLVRLLQRRRPDVVQTWMYHADLLGGLAARLTGGIPIVWNIRQSDVRAEKLLLKFLARVTNPLLSYWIPDAIVYCADRAATIHKHAGYSPAKCVVIPNGFDLDRFKPDARIGAAFRERIGLPRDVPLVGIVARLHPMKDHRNFILAAALVARQVPSAVFVLCGDGLDDGARDVLQWVQESGLSLERVRLVGRRDDIENVYPAFSVAVSSSRSGEGFPNVLGEAMACEVPCVATDVGDSALILGEHGRVVPPGDPAALADAILDVIQLSDAERSAVGAAGRLRIEKHYSLAVVAAQYESLYESVLGRRARPGLDH